MAKTSLGHAELYAALCTLLGLPDMNYVRSVNIKFRAGAPIMADVELFVRTECLVPLAGALRDVEIKRNVIINVNDGPEPVDGT